MPHHPTSHSARPRAGSLIVIRPSIKTAHSTLRRWMADNAASSSISVFGQSDVPDLSMALAPWHVSAVLNRREPPASNPLDDHWRRYLWAVNRYETVIVLCHGDAEVTAGYTAYRILGEVLFSKRVVLIGPKTTQVWPGGRELFTLTRMREIAVLVSAAGVVSFTTAVLLGAVALQEALIRMRLLR